MKKSGYVAASIAVVSATAYSASKSKSNNNIPHESQNVGVSSKKREKSSSQTPASSDKFAPRFDGLRFIETLVTAHR